MGEPTRLAKCQVAQALTFMGALERALIAKGVKPVYAFSARESVDHVQADGSVRKVAVFRHLGFVSGPLVAREAPNVGVRARFARAFAGVVAR